MCAYSIFRRFAIAQLMGVIANATADLQSVPPRALRRFARDLEAAQKVWQVRSNLKCAASAPDDRVARERCRLRATLKRTEEVRAELARARARLGAPPMPGTEAPDSVEILIPLPSPPGGPRVRVRVPLEVPVLPE